MNSGELYVCGSPLGNLQDITLRVIETLKSVDIILCEDTRHSLKLLNHYGIAKRLMSYHEHNRVQMGHVAIDNLHSGKHIALLTDAGMPCISDPGCDLVRLCHQNKIKVNVIPGATAFVVALALSGFDTRRFVFEGFLPRDNKERRDVLNKLKHEHRIIVFYESPHHLQKTLLLLQSELGDRYAFVARELTKLYEETRFGLLSELAEHFLTNTPRGEFVIVLREMHDEKDDYSLLSIPAHVKIYLDMGYSLKESIRLVAVDKNIPKREVYAVIHKQKTV